LPILAALAEVQAELQWNGEDWQQHFSLCHRFLACTSRGVQIEWIAIQERSVETWFCSPATVCPRATSASVRKRMTGAACAPWPLALLPQSVQQQGPPLACSVVPGLWIFAISNSGQLLLAKESVETWFRSPMTVRYRAACANVRKRTTGAACAPRPLAPLALLPHGAPLQGPPVARSVAPGRCLFVICTCNINFYIFQS